MLHVGGGPFHGEQMEHSLRPSTGPELLLPPPGFHMPQTMVDRQIKAVNRNQGRSGEASANSV